MFEKISFLLKNKINEAIDELNKNGILKVGTETLLLAMLNIENSLCFQMFTRRNIKIDFIKRKIISCIYIRKDNEKYTKKLLEVLEIAEKIALADESDIIYDEHLLYAILLTKDNIALQTMLEFGVTLEELNEDIKNIFDLSEEESPYLTNLTKEAINNKLNKFIGRKKYINKIIRVLLKKQKNNPMLIGNAGVGKSALVEGVTLELLKIDEKIVVYRLDLGMVFAGTKYRGDLEERLMGILEKTKGTKCIIFIDEIHNILTNNSSESSLDIANILKPYLARGEIKCIGATTLDEYYQYVAKDKALVRRFQNIFVEEAKESETLEILKGIVLEFEKFYNVHYSKFILKYIIEKCKLLTNRSFPDKAIDILDESGLLSKNKKRKLVIREDVEQVVLEFLGIDYNEFKKNLNGKLNYPSLRKYYYDYLYNLTERKVILSIKTNDENQLLVDDFKKVFNINNENILHLDFKDYCAEHYITNLIGAPSGYVGYSSGGILTEHVNKYPLSLVIIKNFSKGHFLIQNYIKEILKEGIINDNKGRKINFKNTIFIVIEKDENKKIGFKENKEKLESFCDEAIYEANKVNNTSINKIINNYNKNGYYLKVEKDIYYDDRILDILNNPLLFIRYKKNYIYKNKHGELVVENK